MNAESFKSELQQVLNEDVAVRQEFAVLKRAVSDYRNQLILRDEDCKRLQVTIDVLNTKLIVMERENAAHKEEAEALEEMKNSVKEQLQAKQEELEARLAEIETLKSELNSLAEKHETQLLELRNNIQLQEDGMREVYENRIAELTNEFEEKERGFASNAEEARKTEIDNLHSALEEQRSTLTFNFNSQLVKLAGEYAEKETQLAASYENQIAELKSNLSAVDTSVYESQIANLITEYEEKLANAVLHSNNQNFRLNEEVKRLELNGEIFYAKINGLETELKIKDEKITALSSQIETLNSEQENPNQTSLFAETETSCETGDTYISNLLSQIENLNNELGNLGLLFQENTNKLAETETELESATLQLSALNQENESKDLEFQKLLVENNNLINEIESVQSRAEAQEAEINLLKVELEEVKTHNMGKVEDLKETLSNKNIEISNLENSNATLLAEIGILQNNMLALNENTAELNTKISAYETEIQALKENQKTEEQDDGFIDRLFKQIDELSSQRLSLLDEKEQMAVQLLKMNEVIGSISQQVDSENIDVNDLNNHRMNVILATQSEGTNNEKSPMKEQINDLVREIDKCIALLSA